MGIAVFLFLRGPQKEIVIQEADPSDRIAAFEALSALEQAQLEVEANGQALGHFSVRFLR